MDPGRSTDRPRTVGPASPTVSVSRKLAELKSAVPLAPISSTPRPAELAALNICVARGSPLRGPPRPGDGGGRLLAAFDCQTCT
jgi:hypothetical protein